MSNQNPEESGNLGGRQQEGGESGHGVDKVIKALEKVAEASMKLGDLSQQPPARRSDLANLAKERGGPAGKAVEQYEQSKSLVDAIRQQSGSPESSQGGQK